MQIRRQRPRTAANGFEKQDEASEAFKDIIIKYNIINDMTRHKLSGAGAAIPTPFTPDGRVDYPALARTIDYIIDGGVDFIVALGTTAETPTLYLHERAVVAMFIKNHIAGRVPLVIGVGGNSTSEVLDQLREFDLRGADAILSVTPYYNKPSQEGLYQHFKTVSEHSPLPIILYNVPGRTGGQYDRSDHDPHCGRLPECHRHQGGFGQDRPDSGDTRLAEQGFSGALG